MRKAVRIFAEKMETRLKEKDPEQGVQGWLNPDANVRYLFNELKPAFTELDKAFAECNSARLEKACVDVSNWAMMISDRMRGRKG